VSTSNGTSQRPADGPNCATCGARLVAGNNVVRVRRPGGFEWTHAGPCKGRIRLPVDESVFLEEGRLVIETRYGLDSREEKP